VSTHMSLDMLSGLPIFRTLISEDLEYIRQHLTELHRSEGTPLIAMGQQSDAIYIIIEGAVKVQVEQSDGSAVILAILGPGEILGELSLADQGDCSASVIPLTALTALCVSQHDFTALIERIPRLGVNLAAVLAERLRHANEQILTLATLDARSRVARQILTLTESTLAMLAVGTSNPTSALQISQGDLAEMTGMSRVRFNQIVQELKQDGLITIDQCRRILVCNIEGLRRRCTIGKHNV
jgi:CRP/FNR family transcriptional regulator, cyclic AMP receptor protein